MSTLVSPSILSANFAHLDQDIAKAVEAGADWLHFDVMDGVFVNNISYGVPILKCIANIHPLVNDVHLMIINPIRYIKPFADAGADYITFHLEACKDEKEILDTIDEIHKYGKKAGITIKPKTKVEDTYPFLDKVEIVLIMSVEPGFGGQSFDENAPSRIKQLKEELVRRNLNVLIEVDGGVNQETGLLCKRSGVDVLVAGSYLFGKEDIKDRVKHLKEDE